MDHARDAGRPLTATEIVERQRMRGLRGRMRPADAPLELHIRIERIVSQNPEGLEYRFITSHGLRLDSIFFPTHILENAGREATFIIRDGIRDHLRGFYGLAINAYLNRLAPHNFDTRAAEIADRESAISEMEHFDASDVIVAQANIERAHMEAQRRLFMSGMANTMYSHIIGSATQHKKADVNRKAMALLYRKLDKQSRKMLKKLGYFEHEGRVGTYRFMLNDNSGVRLLQKQKLGKREIVTEYELCIQSAESDMPKGDVILSRYLECKNDEDLFLTTANVRRAQTVDEAAINMGGVLADLRQRTISAALNAINPLAMRDSII